MIAFCLFCKTDDFYIACKDGKIALSNPTLPSIKQCASKQCEEITGYKLRSEGIGWIDAEIYPCFDDISDGLIIPVSSFILSKIDLKNGYEWKKITDQFDEISERLIKWVSQSSTSILL